MSLFRDFAGAAVEFAGEFRSCLLPITLMGFHRHLDAISDGDAVQVATAGTAPAK